MQQIDCDLNASNNQVLQMGSLNCSQSFGILTQNNVFNSLAESLLHP